jgi:pectate lyase
MEVFMRHGLSIGAESVLVLALLLMGSAASRGEQPAAAPDFGLIGFATESGGTKGGAGGETVVAATAAEFIAAATSDKPRIIRVSGTLDLGEKSVNLASNKTILGEGRDAGFVGHIAMQGVTNIIIRNLTFTNAKGVGQGVGGGDGMTTHSSHHIWVDHCTFGDCADGQFDITHGSDFITVSWCKFHYTDEKNDHRLSMLIGNKDNLAAEDSGKLHVTLHHNWIGKLVKDRTPRVRFGQVHVFNTYFAPSADNGSCIGVGVDARVLLESSHFDGAKYPWKSRSEGGEKAGRLQVNDDIIHDFPKKPKLMETSTETFKPPYAYTLAPANTVKETVTKYAGAGQGPFAEK